MAVHQTIFYLFMHASRYCRATAINIKINASLYETKTYGGVPLVEAATEFNEEINEITIFAANRRQDEALTLTEDLRGFE